MKNKKGFTLIELLVTIAIISLLASIVFASISSARDKANTTKAVVQGKEINKAIELSRLANNSLPVNTSTSESVKELVSSGNSPTVQNTFQEYYSGDIPEVATSVSGEGDTDYYYISDGVDSVDEYGNQYACGARSNMLGSRPDNSITFYRDKESVFYPGQGSLKDPNSFEEVSDILYFVNSNPTQPDFADGISEVTRNSSGGGSYSSSGFVSSPTEYYGWSDEGVFALASNGSNDNLEYELKAPAWLDEGPGTNVRYFRCVK